MLKFNKIFATVGTTQFNDLITTILTDDILFRFQQINCKQIIIQYGTGSEIDTTSIEQIFQRFAIEIVCYGLKSNIQTDIESSDLVISHAGAGSCIEVLKLKRPLIVVINDKLMDNHQAELAEQLYADGYLLYCTPQTLCETITGLEQKIAALRRYEPGNMSKFVSHLNELMGFE